MSLRDICPTLWRDARERVRGHAAREVSPPLALALIAPLALIAGGMSPPRPHTIIWMLPAHTHPKLEWLSNTKHLMAV